MIIRLKKKRFFIFLVVAVCVGQKLLAMDSSRNYCSQRDSGIKRERELLGAAGFLSAASGSTTPMMLFSLGISAKKFLLTHEFKRCVGYGALTSCLSYLNKDSRKLISQHPKCIFAFASIVFLFKTLDCYDAQDFIRNLVQKKPNSSASGV